MSQASSLALVFIRSKANHSMLVIELLDRFTLESLNANQCLKQNPPQSHNSQIPTRSRCGYRAASNQKLRLTLENLRREMQVMNRDSTEALQALNDNLVLLRREVQGFIFGYDLALHGFDWESNGEKIPYQQPEPTRVDTLEDVRAADDTNHDVETTITNLGLAEPYQAA
ncbi:hypothetical protein CI238_09060 [Colletotrichum incanum]|uniref:Uncharacterized protein n=1 Tax=Colletotrichum incanum TaxID=1573173 RepID=A0A167AZ99_COLIC|nr:hypothetical protein CI238_09060 [Colletotrichum incanum]